MTPKIKDIQRAVISAYPDMTMKDMNSHCRQRRVARPRQIAMFLTRHMAKKSYPEIGRHFDRDHTTVLHAERRILSLMRKDANFGETVTMIWSSIRFTVEFQARQAAAESIAAFCTSLCDPADRSQEPVVPEPETPVQTAPPATEPLPTIAFDKMDPETRSALMRSIYRRDARIQAERGMNEGARVA